MSKTCKIIPHDQTSHLAPYDVPSVTTSGAMYRTVPRGSMSRNRLPVVVALVSDALVGEVVNSLKTTALVKSINLILGLSSVVAVIDDGDGTTIKESNFKLQWTM